jgi:hypothetical protein
VCFKIFTNTLTWVESNNDACGTGGKLAVISDYDLNKYLFDMVYAEGAKKVWVGGTDAANEGTWLWADGTPWIYNHWKKNEPKGGSAKNCALIAKEHRNMGLSADKCDSGAKLRLCQIGTVEPLTSGEPVMCDMHYYNSHRIHQISTLP